MSGIVVEVVHLTGIEVTTGATNLLVQRRDTEVLVLVVDVVVDTSTVRAGSKQGRLPIILTHLSIHGVVGVEAVVGDLVLLVVDLNVLATIVDGGVQGHTLGTISCHSDLGTVAQNNRSLLALPVFEMLTVQVLVGVAPVLEHILTTGILNRDGVLVDRNLISTTGGVADGLAFAAFLAKLTILWLRSAAATPAWWALMTEVKI